MDFIGRFRRKHHKRRKEVRTHVVSARYKADRVSPIACVWTGMGLGSSYSPTLAPNCALIVLVILGIICKTVYSCDVNPCYNKLVIAQKSMNSEERSQKESICIPLRTYYTCLQSLHGCKGSLKFHSNKRVTKNQMDQNNCSEEGSVYEITGHETIDPPPDPVCTFQGVKKYKHCSLFGDPHLRTFTNQFQTCKVKGAWTLVDTKSVLVQVTNDAVSNTVGATATSKLTVMIRRNSECGVANFLTYQAQTDSLPGEFYDGKSWYGPGRSVELIERDPGKHIEIIIRYIDTKIHVRQVGSYFTFSIIMPEEVINASLSNGNSLELCSRGCPRSEIINYEKFLASKEEEIEKMGAKIVMPRREALKICQNEGLVDFYLDSCVFDLMTTGNENFTSAAYKSLQDLKNLDPSVVLNGRTDLPSYSGYSKGVSLLHSRTTMLGLFRILLLTFVTRLIILAHGV